MKLKIKVKVLVDGCMPEINKLGDCIDLRSAVNMNIPAPQSGTLKRRVDQDGNEVGYRNVTMETYYVPLGVAMELPKGFTAKILSRSSTPRKVGLFIPNGLGFVDNLYKGEEDEWNYICSPMRETSIKKGDRICQFEIGLSQHTSTWQKLKWLLSSGIKLVEVENLGGKQRGGLGSTGLR